MQASAIRTANGPSADCLQGGIVIEDMDAGSSVPELVTTVSGAQYWNYSGTYAIENNLIVKCGTNATVHRGGIAIDVGGTLSANRALHLNPFFSSADSSAPYAPAGPGNPSMPIQNNFLLDCGVSGTESSDQPFQGPVWYSSDGTTDLSGSDQYGTKLSRNFAFHGEMYFEDEEAVGLDYSSWNSSAFRIDSDFPMFAVGSMFRIDLSSEPVPTIGPRYVGAGAVFMEVSGP